jgi:large subunit ribosomal protein L12
MGLEYIYAALLLHELGKPLEENALSSVIKAAGIEPDMARVKQVVETLSKVDIDKILAQVQAAPVMAPPVAEKKEVKEEKREEKKKEEKKEEEEVALEGLAGLFG